MAEGSGKRMMVSSQCWWNLRVCLSLAFAATIAITGFLGLLKPVTNGCTMTYMYPTYIPVPAPPNATSNRYALYLYHEGWKKIDYQLELVKLSGVPVLFIPGNGGSYKQVWSLIFFFSLSFTSRSRFAHQGRTLCSVFQVQGFALPKSAADLQLFSVYKIIRVFLCLLLGKKNGLFDQQMFSAFLLLSCCR